MKIDFIFYSDDYAVGVVYTEKLLAPGIALLRKYPNCINSEVLEDLKSRCRFLLNDKKMTDYLRKKYDVCDFIIDESDCSLIAKLFTTYYKKSDLLLYISGDDNFEELAKCSDTDFVFCMFSLMWKVGNIKKFKIPYEQIFLVAKVLAERGNGAGYILVASVYYKSGDKDLALQYFNEAEKLGINSKVFIEILDNINI